MTRFEIKEDEDTGAIFILKKLSKDYFEQYGHATNRQCAEEIVKALNWKQRVANE